MAYQAMTNLAYDQIVPESEMDIIRENIEFLASLEVSGVALSDLDEGDTISGVAYDSGWFAVVNNNIYQKAHGLAGRPRIVVILHSATSDGSDEWVDASNRNSNIAEGLVGLGWDGTNVIMRTGTTYTVQNNRRQSNTGYYRVIAYA